MRPPILTSNPKKVLVSLILSILFTASATSQSHADATQNEPLNIGFVLYTKSSTPGTLVARWNYGNAYSGPGLATGGPREAGYTGNYHVRYFYENGDFSDEYDLTIEKAGDFYEVTWVVNGRVAARGVGMEVENGLAVGWRRVSE